MKADQLEKLFSGIEIVTSEPVKSESSTVASRKAAWKSAIAEFDVDRLISVQEEMNDFVDKMKVLTKVEGELELTEKETEDLMLEFLSVKSITEFLEARKSMLRTIVFQVIEERLREEGVEDPANTNGKIEVPELGKKFCKEGAGLKDPTLDGAKFRSLIGDKIDQVIVKKVIPEKVVEEIDEAKLFELAAKDETVLEALKESTILGKPKTAKFVVRDMK